ncbi:hypothetical protein PR003_g6320 [Phytophthora rubi]|uniref:Uncharacterized protein n=1 Tax=Phytophthora rubi TaxID=129364 RepID=A0A6A4FQU3_9STRA|nr:hypothetical protein PR003_g6320 [Phytophthora rubi]
MAPGQVLRDKTAKSAPVYREMGRDHSSDEDFVVDQAAPDLDDSPNEGPPRKKTRTQGRPDVQARSKKERKPAVRSTPNAGHAEDPADHEADTPTLPPAPDTPKTPPTVTPDTSEPKPTKCHGAPDPKQAPMPEPATSRVQKPKKPTTPTQKPYHTSAKRAISKQKLRPSKNKHYHVVIV